MLQVIPCADAQDCGNETEVASSLNHSDHEHETESCTPFCVCACCGTSGIVKLNGYQSIKRQAYKQSHTLLNTPPIQEMTIAIWQPPKIS